MEGMQNGCEVLIFFKMRTEGQTATDQNLAGNNTQTCNCRFYLQLQKASAIVGHGSAPT